MINDEFIHIKSHGYELLELILKLYENYEVDIYNYKFISLNNNTPFIPILWNKNSDNKEKLSVLLKDCSFINRIRPIKLSGLQITDLKIVNEDPFSKDNFFNENYISNNKLNLSWKFTYDLNELNLWGHRSGWPRVMKHILENSNIKCERQYLLVDVMEKLFSWDYKEKTDLKHIWYENHTYSIEWSKLRSINDLHVADLNGEYVYWDRDLSQWLHFDLPNKFLTYPIIGREDSPNRNINFSGNNYLVKYSDIRLINDKQVIRITNFSETEIYKYIYWKPETAEWLDYNLLDGFQSYPEVYNNIPEEDFVCFWHNPHNMPLWYDYHTHPKVILDDPIRRNCIQTYCKGIFVFSEYFAKYIRQELNIPVNVLYHPTDIPDIKFNWDNFIINKDKKLIQLGYWLRKTTFIFQLKTDLYKKLWCYGSKWAFKHFSEEVTIHDDDLINNVTCIRVSDQDYDKLLSENIAILYLYDTSVNNSVIECIARNTPLVVNYHPALVEYLGEDYPLFYHNIEECEKIINDFNLLHKGYLHLQKPELQRKISYKTFIEDFINSSIIKQLDL